MTQVAGVGFGSSIGQSRIPQGGEDASSVFLSGFLCLGISTALAQDPVKVSPETHTVLLENDPVRVLDMNGRTSGFVFQSQKGTR